MRQKIFSRVLLIILSISLCSCKKYANENLIFVCNESNDLYSAVVDSNGEYQRFNSVEEAVEIANNGSGILVLADNYPAKKVKLSEVFFKRAKEKGIKLYVEYPDNLPSGKTDSIKEAGWGRGVVTSNVFGESLKEMSIVMMHDCHYVDIEAENPYISTAKIAGFNKAIYGLEDTESSPILYEYTDADILVSTTKLSQFISGRYSPKDAWKPIWNFVFNYLQPNETIPKLEWQEAVRPMFQKEEEITQQDKLESINKGVEWFYKSNLLNINLENTSEALDTTQLFEEGDLGKEGIYECFLSKINYDGSQKVGKSRRADCASESAMAIAMRNFISPNELDKSTATNLQDFVYFNSDLQQKSRNDVDNPSYGFIAWYVRKEQNSGIYYGDDNARVILGTLMSGAALKSNRWDEGIVKAILANLRSTSSTGFKPNRLKEKELDKLGWEHFRDQKEFYQFAPHYQSWIMATYLWLYDKTSYEPLLVAAKAGIENLMNAYPNEWRWTNGLQQERARMVLPLAWLVRVDDTPLHREWLNTMVNDLLSFQDESGAIREDLGSGENGRYGPPKSNEDYGTTEAPLIQENGDPIADMLYTTNFAFFSLTEAAAVLNDERVNEAVNKLSDFMVKIQVNSEANPELDGAWFRAFDFDRWEYWGSNADLGWGVWSTETGWTQSWISTMLTLNHLNTTVWDFSSNSKIADKFEEYKVQMLTNK